MSEGKVTQHTVSSFLTNYFAECLELHIPLRIFTGDDADKLFARRALRTTLLQQADEERKPLAVSVVKTFEHVHNFRLAAERELLAKGVSLIQGVPNSNSTELIEHLKQSREYSKLLGSFQAAFVEWVNDANGSPVFAPKKKSQVQAETAVEFSIHTSQEMDLWHRAQCDGKTFDGYMTNEQAGAIFYERTGQSHRIRIALTDDERTAGLALSSLENLVRSQDADAVLATAYILGALAPPPHLPTRQYAGGWIDFDQAIKKIGWYPQTTVERREMHARIWEFVRFGERAHIIGKRTGAKYKDADGQEIDTSIHGAIWRVMKTETPDVAEDAPMETPVRAEIVVSKELTALLTHPKTAQYLQGAEILGAIPGGKPAGAWARVIGVALMSFWRRRPRETMATILKPTRRELLDHYAAKVAPYEEVLESNNPARVIEYWCSALHILAAGGFIERTGEAAITPQEMRASLPRQGWKDVWLDQEVDIEPGGITMKPQLVERAEALPALKARDLKQKPRAKKRAKTQ